MRWKPKSDSGRACHSITHGVGVGSEPVGLGVLLVLSILHGTAWHIAGCTVFGLSLVGPVHRVYSLPQSSTAALQAHLKDTRSCGYLSPHRGYLHAIHAGESERRVGLDSADVRLELALLGIVFKVFSLTAS